MRLSVIVLATGGPGDDAGRTLEALRRQTHPDFEVVVASGAPRPEGADWTTIPVTKGENPAAAWNRAAAAAAGEAVAFLEAGSLPAPRWLESLEVALDGAAAAGGPVRSGWDQGGAPWSLCDRRGMDCGRAGDPVWPYAVPAADVFLRLSPRNCCFRRGRYLDLGGLDEELPWPLPVAGLCARLLDRGLMLRHAAGAVVYHDGRAERWPCVEDVLRDPAGAARAAALFALRHSPHETGGAALRRCHEAFEALLAPARRDRNFGPERAAALEEAVERGLWTGTRAAHSGQRRPRLNAGGRPFLPLATFRQADRALNVVIIEKHGRRAAWPLARDLAAGGHEVHYVAAASGATAVRFAEGVWVHDPTAAHAPHVAPAGTDPAAREALRLAAAAHRLIRELHLAAALDVVCVPRDALDGLYCLLDDDLTCVLHGPPAEGEEVPPALLTLLRERPRPTLSSADEAVEWLRRAARAA